MVSVRVVYGTKRFFCMGLLWLIEGFLWAGIWQVGAAGRYREREDGFSGDFCKRGDGLLSKL
jgi:hypothetical protein